jgi:hypothetical protein
MTSLRFWLAALSYVVISLAWAFPWHMVWFHERYAQMGAMTRAEPIIPLGMLSMAIQGLVIAYLYPRWYRGGNPVVAGIRFSLIVGLLVYSVMGPATVAKFAIEPATEFLAYHTVFQLLQFVFTGFALGLIYGRIESTSAASQV